LKDSSFTDLIGLEYKEVKDCFHPKWKLKHTKEDWILGLTCGIYWLE